MTLTLDRPFTASGPVHWGARFIYTHATAEQNGNDLFSLDLPSAADYARHPVAGSEPNHFLATGLVGIPWDIRLSTTITWGDGPAVPVFDFSQGFGYNDRFKTGVLNRAVYPPGGYRQLDFRLAKDFNVGKGRIGASLDVINATNHANYGCLSNFQAPDTNPSTLGQPGCTVTLGRREQVGLKYTF